MKHPTVAGMNSGSLESATGIRHSEEYCLRVLELDNPTRGQSPSEPIQSIPNVVLHILAHLECAFSWGPNSVTALHVLLRTKLPPRLSQRFCADLPSLALLNADLPSLALLNAHFLVS